MDSLPFSILNLLCALAAFGPFQNSSAVWLLLWQCGKGEYNLVGEISAVCF